jgi:thiol-disulfide isomerase/thioredoxin
MRASSVLFCALGLVACENEPPIKKETKPAGKVEIVQAPPADDAAASIQREAARAKDEGRTLLVYVGAPWCEPCQRFHRAAEAGELDSIFPKLRLLEFDRDRDEARLSQAGCISHLIPLFAKPDALGHCSADRIEGSIKGDGAVAEITPRLRRLVE